MKQTPIQMPKALVSRMSVFKWQPDLEKTQEVLNGAVPTRNDDKVVIGGMKWPTRS